MKPGVFPRKFQGILFVVLTFLNAGLASFFIAADELQLAGFSGVTALLCFGVWEALLRMEEKDINDE